MEQARATFLSARMAAQHLNYQQLTLALMQTLQPWGVTTDIRALPLTRADANAFEQFWRMLFDKVARNKRGEYETPFSQIKGWALLVCAVVHSADLGHEFLPMASKKCDDVAATIDRVLLRLERSPEFRNTPPPQTAAIVTLHGGALPLAATQKSMPTGHSKLHLVEPPQE